jgi:hypothetical protein
MGELADSHVGQIHIRQSRPGGEAAEFHRPAMPSVMMIAAVVVRNLDIANLL